MTELTRRGALLGAGSLGALASACAAAPIGQRREGEISASGLDWSHLKWARGIENQRRADRGDGRYLNPVLAGDHPDPSILRDGDRWLMTHSSFESYPGLLIWESRDLVNWTPLTAALRTNVGSVWAPELVKHQGRYFIYIPARFPDRRSIYVIDAEKAEGPWSEPVDLHLPNHIDPGHAVGEDGKRWLFLSGGDRIALAGDGLSTTGMVEHAYDPWRYPPEWVVEGFAPEGPKVMRHGEWFYLITAVGGTSGPPTGHMVIAARSRSINGPWEQCPHNPIVRTWSAREKWWSRGHASLIEGPGTSGWFMVYHGYENGFWTLGRQTLLDPVVWTKDGWFEAKGGDLSKPLPMPARYPGAKHGMALSDDFASAKLGPHWSFFSPGPKEAERIALSPGLLRLKASGSTPTDSKPLTFVAGDLGYDVIADLEIDEGAEAGVLLFYSPKLYAGLGFNGKGLVMHRAGGQRRGAAPAQFGRRLDVRVTNDRHIVSMATRTPGGEWIPYGVRLEVSGYNHNVGWDFLSLRPGLYCAGQGECRVRSVKYRAL